MITDLNSATVGPFRLSDNFNNLLTELRRARDLEIPTQIHFSPDTTIVEVVGGPVALIEEDRVVEICVELVEKRFPGFPKVELLLKPATLRNILSSLPPTRQGQFISHPRKYILLWDLIREGIPFELSVEFDLSNFAESEWIQALNATEHPLGNGDGPIAKRFTLRESIKYRASETAKRISCEVSKDELKFPGFSLQIGKTTVQDVYSDIGEPEKFDKYAKGWLGEDHLSKILLPFFKKGLLLVFTRSTDSPVLERILIFNNLPGHRGSFGVFSRCPWRLASSDFESFSPLSWKSLSSYLPKTPLPLVFAGGELLFDYPSLGLAFECVHDGVAVVQIYSSGEQKN